MSCMAKVRLLGAVDSLERAGPTRGHSRHGIVECGTSAIVGRAQEDRGRQELGG